MDTKKLINIKGEIVNKEIMVKKGWKFAILKVGMRIRNIKNFLAIEQSVNVSNFNSKKFKIVGNNKKLSGKLHLQELKTVIDYNGYGIANSPVNIGDIVSNKDINHLGNSSCITSAQIVYNVIQMQQIEWMKDGGK